VNYTLSGSNVTTWTDTSGFGNDATQSTDADRPSVTSADLNGKDTIDFDGANSEWMTIASDSSHETSNFTTKCLMYNDSLVPNDGILLAKWGSASTKGFTNHVNSANNIQNFIGDTSCTFSTTAFAQEATVVVDQWQLGNWKYDKTNVMSAIDSNSYITSSATFDLCTSASVKNIGTILNAVTGSYTLDARIAFLIFCNYAISAAQETDLTNYINYRWGQSFSR
jgi:hypothetical protein